MKLDAQLCLALLELAFGDIDDLGKPGLAGNEEYETFDDLDLADLGDLVAKRSKHVAAPSLADAIKVIIDSTSADCLGLLRSACIEDARLDLRSAYSVLTSQKESWHADGPLPFDIADSHLHSGASLSMSVLLDCLASRSFGPSRRSKAEPLLTRTGRRLDAVVLLAALRWSTRFVWVYSGDPFARTTAPLEELGFSEVLVSRVFDGSFWKLVADLASKPNASGRNSPEYAALASRFPADGAVTSFHQAFWNLVDDHRESVAWATSFTVDLVRLIVGIHEYVTSQPAEGLPRFVDRFSRAGFVRDLAVGSARAKSVHLSLREWGSHPRVVGAEFRKTFRSEASSTFRSEIRDELSAHLTGFARYLREDGRALALSMPIGLARFPSTTSPGVAAAQELRHALAGVDAIRSLAAADVDAFANAVWSIDVAGNEIGSANWPFLVAATALERHDVPLEFAMHAGEAFVSELNGVRRVGELLLGERAPTRVGHCLALSSGAAKKVCRTDVPISRLDALLDALWATRAGLGGEQAEALIYDLVAPVGGQRALGVGDWLAGYERLYDFAALQGLGLIVNIGGVYGAAGVHEIHEICRAGSVVDRALGGLAYGLTPAITGCDLNSSLAYDSTILYRAFSDAICEKSRAFVANLFRERGILIEACPTSNIKIAGLEDDYGSHPMWQWLEDGHQVSVSSDDPLMLNSDIYNEFRTLQKQRPQQGELLERAAAASVQSCSGNRRRRLTELEELQARLGIRTSRRQS